MYGTSSTLKGFWRDMPDSRMLSFWFLHWVFRVVELQASLGPLRFDILLFWNSQNTRIFYTIVISRRNVPAIRIYYCTVALLQLNSRNKSEITQQF